MSKFYEEARKMGATSFVRMDVPPMILTLLTVLATLHPDRGPARRRVRFARRTQEQAESPSQISESRGTTVTLRATVHDQRTRHRALELAIRRLVRRPRHDARGSPRLAVVAKPHFPWTKIVISSDEKRRSSRSLPGPFAAEQPTDASYLSRVVRCAPASDEAPRGPNWQSINRRTRRPKFHDERPATPRCLLALPTEASSFP